MVIQNLYSRILILFLTSFILLHFSSSNCDCYSQIFAKITQGDIVNDGGESRGCAWGDYDNDGYLDLYVTNHYSEYNFLYINNRNGTFTKISSGAIVDDANTSYGATWGDYNDDGALDLFVANFFHENNSLYYNNGNGTFTKITSGDIVNDGEDSRNCTWGDYDNDGYLDMFVANAIGKLNFLYKNNGEGTFTKITSGAIVNDGGNSSAGCWADYDNDGYLDLFVANAIGEPNFLYDNNGDGTFTKITSGAIVTDIASSVGGSWGDYDNDGDLDLFVPNLDQNNFLYDNNGDGTFAKNTNSIIVNDPAISLSGAWGDFDNDGDLDLFVANGGNNISENNSLYSNNGDGTFTKINNEPIVTDGGFSHDAAWCDYDNDDDLDLFVTNRFGNNFLYSNNGNSNNWINIKCEGTSLSNYSAIGTKVKAKATIGGDIIWQMREISGQSGTRSQNSLNVEFGLGDATTIDSLIVEWPASDTTQIFTEVSVNQFLTIQEPSVPAIRSVVPDKGYQSLSVTTRIRGNNTHFSDSNGTLEVSLTMGVDTIYATSFVDSTNVLLEANFDIPLEAQTGDWDFSVRTDIDGKLTWRIPFKILPQLPAISVNPTSVQVEISKGDSLDVAITLFNQGGSDLNWSASIQPPSTSSQEANTGIGTQEQPAPSSYRRGNAPPSFQRMPQNDRAVDSHKNVLLEHVFSQGSWAYGIDISNQQFLRFNLLIPQNVVTISSISGDFFGGDFDENGNFYAVDNNTSVLTILDTLSGVSQVVGPMGNLSGHTWTGLTYDATTSTMYASSTDGSISTLYAVNLSSGATTVIGSTSVAPIIIDIAIDIAGTLYAHEIINDAIFIIDKTNAGATLVGSTGFDANYAQGMDFDPTTNELYLAAFNNFNLEAELRKVNLTTGSSTLLGSIGNGFGIEVDAFGIAGTGSLPYLKLLPPTSGTIPPAQQTNMFARIYGVVERARDTTLTASIEITSNDPFNPVVVIPIEIDVVTTGIKEKAELPLHYAISQNYPNPFNPETIIKFQLPQSSDVRLEIFNVLGQKIVTLVSGGMAAGYHKVIWDGRNSNQNSVSGGIYIYKFQASDYRRVQKMILLK